LCCRLVLVSITRACGMGKMSCMRCLGLLMTLWPQALADMLCEKAFKKGCYARQPFEGCCHQGECQKATSNITCQWGYGMPCCPDLYQQQFEFPLGPNALNCQRACDAMGSNTNVYMDYCRTNGRLWQNRYVATCPEALKSLETATGIADPWCFSKTDYQCTWSFKYKTQIGGQFSWKDTDSFADSCSTACAQLGNPTAPAETFCRLTSSFPTLRHCTPAFDSVKSQPIPPSWCSGSEALYTLSPGIGHHEISKLARNITRPALPFSEANTTAVSLSAADEDPTLCERAWANKCWDDPSFTTCCHDCVDAEVTHECHCTWKFGYNNGFGLKFIGSTVVMRKEGFSDCDKACDALGDETRNPQWFCETTKVVNDKVISRCSGLVEDFKNKIAGSIPWCQNQSLTATMITPSSGNRSPNWSQDTASAAVATLAFMTAIAAVVKFRSWWHVRQDDSHQPFLE